MRKRVLFGSGILFAVIALPSRAQTPKIEHQPVACASADRFARLEARFLPTESVAVARIVFQGQTADCYSVAMKPEGAGFAGVLPKPKKSLKSFRYYIEVTDKALGTTRTADYTAAVVDSAGACKGKVMAAALGSASVILQSPAGVAALPAGFASTGVVAGSAAGSGSAAGAAGAAAGGGHAVAIALGVVGAGAVAGGVTLASKANGDEITQQGNVYLGACTCARNDPPPFRFPTSGPIQNAVVSTNLNSTATSDAAGHFVLTSSDPQRTCMASITAPGCSTSTWRCGTGTIYLSLVCSSSLSLLGPCPLTAPCP